MHNTPDSNTPASSRGKSESDAAHTPTQCPSGSHIPACTPGQSPQDGRTLLSPGHTHNGIQCPSGSHVPAHTATPGTSAQGKSAQAKPQQATCATPTSRGEPGEAAVPQTEGNGSATATATLVATHTATAPEASPLATDGATTLLCFDIGNTSAHWALFIGGQITQRGDIPTRSISEGADLLLRAWPKAALGACSVVPAATESLKELAAVHGRSLYLLTAQDAPTLTITYPRPAEIGPDRLANAIGAQALYGAPSIVIDMGTATTFDIISRSSGYIGGIIAPGLAAMTHYLHEKTALLPQLDPNALEQGPHIGQSTTEAMAVGTTRGYPGMIAALLQSATAELASRGEPAATVILTGGASRGFIRKAFAEHPADPDLTLKGLAIALSYKLGDHSGDTPGTAQQA